MVTEIVDAVGDWATRLVFSPTVWVGVVLGGRGRRAVVVSGMPARRAGRTPSAPSRASRARGALGAGGHGRREARRRRPSTRDAEMAEIEALLRKRGIR